MVSLKQSGPRLLLPDSFCYCVCLLCVLLICVPVHQLHLWYLKSQKSASDPLVLELSESNPDPLVEQPVLLPAVPSLELFFLAMVPGAV